MVISVIKRCKKCGTATNNFYSPKTSYCVPCTKTINRAYYANRKLKFGGELAKDIKDKHCPKCNETKPYTPEYWYPSRSWCKECVRKDGALTRLDKARDHWVGDREFYVQVISQIIPPPEQTCAICKVTKPFTGEHFNAPDMTSVGLLYTNICREHAEYKQFARCLHCGVSTLLRTMFYAKVPFDEVRESAMYLYERSLCMVCVNKLKDEGRIRLDGRIYEGEVDPM